MTDRLAAVAKGSWRTTAVGVIGALALLAHQLVAVLDDDPLTKLNPDAILTALGVLGVGYFARDNGVTSEQAGAK